MLPRKILDRTVWPVWGTTAFGLLLVGVIACWSSAQDGEPAATDDAPAESASSVEDKQIIGATAKVVLTAADVTFTARVDTGAQSTSLHVEEIEVENGSDNPRENWGKKVRFRIQNQKGATAWIDSVIDRTVIIRTADQQERRYKVPLKLKWHNLEKTVFVTLNDRSEMSYPLLLGRDFLRGDLLVDVEIDDENEEVPDEENGQNGN